MRSVLLAFALGALFVGCAPEIGDSCKSSVDCSVQGDRICDETLPNGYCTVLNCDPDSCPNGARCVEWRGGFDRTAIRVCMKRCNGEGGCREGYECIGDERMNNIHFLMDFENAREAGDVEDVGPPPADTAE